MGEPLTKPKLLLVEGKDEVNFMSAITTSQGIGDVDVRSFDGGSQLRGYLKALRSVGGFDNVSGLGIVRDAETSGGNVAQSVRDALGAAGLAVPAAALQIAGGSPRVAFLINPHNRATGSLDTLCVAAVAAEPAMECVEGYLKCLNDRGVAIAANVDKARVHAFLASRDRPEISLGHGAKRGYFPLEHASFDTIRQLLVML